MEFYPSVFKKNREKSEFFVIKWHKISFELNKSTFFPKNFKTDKQCKEHWNNHLNPFVNK